MDFAPFPFRCGQCSFPSSPAPMHRDQPAPHVMAMSHASTGRNMRLLCFQVDGCTSRRFVVNLRAAKKRPWLLCPEKSIFDLCANMGWFLDAVTTAGISSLGFATCCPAMERSAFEVFPARTYSLRHFVISVFVFEILNSSALPPTFAGAN